MTAHHKINYLEIPSQNLKKTKKFFGDIFDWSFIDYGPDYCCFTNGGIEGGFFKSDLNATTKKGSVLIVLYSSDLEASQAKIEKRGGRIIKPVFPFPGGRRFHFCDPNGNEYAVWSE